MKINLRMEILDSLVDTDRGIEQVEGLFKAVFHDTIASKVQILTEIENLLEEKLIYVAHYDKEEDSNWYAMTLKGRAIWDAFDWDTYLKKTKSLYKDDD